MPRLELHPLEEEEVSLFAGAAAVEDALVATSLEVDGSGEATGAWEVASWVDAVGSLVGVDSFVEVEDSDDVDDSEDGVEALLVASSVDDAAAQVGGTLVSVSEAEVASREEL